jgi:iron complex transport system substrate-binding protein
MKHRMFTWIGMMLLVMASSLFAKGSSDNQTAPLGKTVIISHRLGRVKVPYDPHNLALLDFAALDILNGLGLGDRVTGVAKSTTVSYLRRYTDNDRLANLGTVKEVDMETLYASKPEVIFIGPRLSQEYQRLSAIAPVVLVAVDHTTGYMQSLRRITQEVASIFAKEDTAATLVSGFDERIEILNRAAAGKTALAVMVTSGSIHTIGNGVRCSLIFNEVGFTNLAAHVTSTHGDSASFELLLEKNPDYLFVLDRDWAIGTAGSRGAQEIMENELVQQTDAYAQGHIVYLTPDVWYLAEGGITATDTMLKDLEAGILDR